MCVPSDFLAPNAGPQALPIAKARNERRLLAVACTPSLGWGRTGALSGPFPCPCTPLLDHLIRLEEERRGDGEAQSLGGLEVNDQLKPHGLLHRQVAGLGPLENLVHIGRRTAPAIQRVVTV